MTQRKNKGTKEDRTVIQRKNLIAGSKCLDGSGGGSGIASCEVARALTLSIGLEMIVIQCQCINVKVIPEYQ